MWLFKSRRDDHKCPSVALMFQVGESATYHNVRIFLKRGPR